MPFAASKRYILVAASVCAVLASLDFAIAHVNDAQLPPRCMHNDIVSKQLEGMNVEVTMASAQFQVNATMEAPSARAALSSNPDYRPLRIAVFTEDVRNRKRYCTSTLERRPNFLGSTVACAGNDILSDAKKKIFLDSVIPAAIKMHEERLMVKPVSHIAIPKMEGSVCGSFTIPQSVRTNGVSNVDFVLFVAAGPVRGKGHSWGMTCGYGADMRPLVGVVNISPFLLDSSDMTVRFVAHEIMHALGFDARLFIEKNMVATARRTRGMPYVSVVDSPNVVQHMGNQFKCDAVSGMELAYHRELGLTYSSWTIRNGRQDIMGYFWGSPMKYSAITMAAMEDLGFYKPVYEKAEHMEWGFGAGCGLLKDKCVSDGVSKFPHMFCTDRKGTKGPSVCSDDRKSVGWCPVFRVSTALPSYFQYFSDAHTGATPEAEYCPFITKYSNAHCDSGKSSLLSGSLLGSSSRCVDVAPGSKRGDALCVDVRCNSATQSYTIKFLSGTTYVKCPAGSTVDASASSSRFPKGSTIVCPPYGSVCPANFGSLNVAVRLETAANIDCSTSSPGGTGGTGGHGNNGNAGDGSAVGTGLWAAAAVVSILSVFLTV